MGMEIICPYCEKSLKTLKLRERLGHKRNCERIYFQSIAKELNTAFILSKGTVIKR